MQFTKKKRKREDSGSDVDLDVTPPSSPTGGRSRVADSDRRRSGRSTGRKKYVDDVDYNLSGQATNLIFLLFPFCKKKSLTCLEGKSMTPCQGNTFLIRSFQQLDWPRSQISEEGLASS